MKIALTIAASDSSAGAGIQADLGVFRDMGVYGVCAITNVTAQNSLGVHKVNKVPPKIIAAQIDDVTKDFNINACKIGMLYFPQAVDIVAERIQRREIPHVVLDPVMKAKKGEVLLTEPAIKRLKRKLMPVIELITPNREEAEILTGIKITDANSAKESARFLNDIGARNVLIKGGHAAGEPVDLLFDGESFTEYPGKRLDKNMHGTGCVLSAAIAARLACGDDIITAVGNAKNYISQAIERSIRIGKGKLDYYFGS